MPDVTLTEAAYLNGVRAGNAGDVVPQELADEHDWAYEGKTAKPKKTKDE